ncbi:MAG: UDP-3-O-acyl-N-acetylglucosamine deacetylase [Bacteroidales bacterium]|nr:UDP-3-O-acyl-N-acetylglucosamine deacetylase [Bacteroidales bacterium]
MHPTQQTVAEAVRFEGKGLHTGTFSRIKICPAPADSGIVFVRTDLETPVRIPALAENVTSTARSTTISVGEVSVVTIEHIMSALTGLGIDNAVIEVEGLEIPILDGSAKPYVEAIKVKDQGVPRKMLELPEVVEIKYENTGAFVRIEPAESFSFHLKVDFNSKVLGIQEASYDESVDYASEIAVCRTFVFFHEIEFLFKNNLIKGGDVDNAIVIVEHPVSDEQLSAIASLVGKPKIKVTSEGYLDNLTLRFPNECGRHKLLDLIGDIRLAGGFPKAKITAFKPGHGINTTAAKAVRQLLKKSSK